MSIWRLQQFWILISSKPPTHPVEQIVYSVGCSIHRLLFSIRPNLYQWHKWTNNSESGSRKMLDFCLSGLLHTFCRQRFRLLTGTPVPRALQLGNARRSNAHLGSKKSLANFRLRGSCTAYTVCINIRLSLKELLTTITSRQIQVKGTLGDAQLEITEGR